MSLLVLGSMGAAGLGSHAMLRARNDGLAAIAFEASQGALEQGLALTLRDVTAAHGLVNSTVYDLTEDFQAIASGCTATVRVDASSDGSYGWVTSTVTYGGLTKSLRTMVVPKDVGIWNNAVFAGAGAGGNAIKGNVDIRGSMHILGEGEAYTDLNGNGKWDAAEPFTDSNKNGVWDPGEPYSDVNGDGVWTSVEPWNDANGNGIYDMPLTHTDLDSSLSGNAYVGNNYSGMPAELEAQVTAPPRINGIETLSAELRCQHGQISVSGSATIGTSAVVDGGTSKGTLDGVYVSDGFTGSQGAAGVFSDNGSTTHYDLDGLDMKFPLLSGIGADPYVDSGGVKWPDKASYLDSASMTIPVSTITATTGAFYYADGKGNSISFTPADSGTGAPALLSITGIIKVSGDLQLGDGKDLITYQGSGSFYSTGNIGIDCNLLPAAGKRFPDTAKMGFIGAHNLALASKSGASQLSIMGAFYAQGTLSSQKQNQIAGTFVANLFDMGTNVPSIYQVPSLSRNMPPGMPGDQSIMSLRLHGWRER